MSEIEYFSCYRFQVNLFQTQHHRLCELYLSSQKVLHKLKYRM